MPLYKVWSGERSVRKLVKADSMKELLDKGKEKLGIPNSEEVRLVLNEDGTDLDEEALEYFPNETLIMLTTDQEWCDPSQKGSTLVQPVRTNPGQAVSQQGSTLVQPVRTNPGQAIIQTNADAVDFERNSEMEQPSAKESSGKTTPQSVNSKSTVSLLAWPVPYKIKREKFRPSLTKALAEKRLLTYGEKQSLIDSLYDDMTRYTFRPTSAQYKEVTTALLTNYPVLKNGLQGTLAVDFWKASLSNRFRNERKRHEKDNPLAQKPKKVKADQAPVEAQSNNKGKAMYGIKNYLPTPPDGEDEDTIKQHIKMLQAEAKKTRQSDTMIEELMTLTLANRRHNIVNNNWTCQQVKEEYPCLFQEVEMLKEFERLMEEPIRPKLEEGLKKYAAPLVALKSKSSELKDEVLAAVAELDEQSEDKKHELLSYGALMLLPTVLGEKVDFFICPPSKKLNLAMAHIKPNKDVNFKTLIENNDSDIQYTIVIEHMDVCTTTNFFSAVCLLVAVHYIFNLSYNKKLRNTLTFIQKILLNVYDEGSTPSRVRRCLYDLNTILAKGC